MTPLDHAIANLDSALRRTLVILWGYQDVRDGRPRSAREPMIHHVEYLDLYRQARVDADLLAGQKEEL